MDTQQKQGTPPLLPMKIAIASFCCVLLLYVAAQLLFQEENTPTFSKPTPQKVLNEETEEKQISQTEISKSPIEETSNDPTDSEETKEERFARLRAELEERKPEMSHRHYILESSILNAELALAEESKSIQETFTKDEEKLIDQFYDKKERGEPIPKEAILASLDESSSPAMYYVAGNLFAESRDINNAIDFYTTALDQEQELPENLVLKTNKNLAVMLVKTGDFDRARSHLQKAIYLTEIPDTTLHGLLGLAELNSGNLEASEYHYKKAIGADPDIYDWQVGLAKNLLDQEKHEEAIDLMKSMIANPIFDNIKPKG